VPTSAMLRLMPVDSIGPDRDSAFELHGSGASLLATLVGALIELLMPGASVEQVETASQPLRPTDVLLMHRRTGRSLVVFGAAPDAQAVSRHLAAGAYSLIGLDASHDELTLAITSLLDGPAFVSASVVKALAAQSGPGPSRTSHLTAREHEITSLLVLGLSNREIGERLCVSPNTVRSHLQSVSSKFGVSSRARLAIRARELGLA
jgi:DNA-binding NarL/FixJ family response regulator